MTGFLSNLYAGKCACGVHVPAGDGSATKAGKKWTVRCQACTEKATAS